MTLRGLLADEGVVGTWDSVPERSSVRFTNRTLWGLMKVKGEFTEVTAGGSIDTGGAISGRVVIGADSVHTGIRKRDEHLRSADFFDTARFPEIAVDIAGATPTGDHSADLDATLTVRGNTRPLPLTATVTRLANDTVHIVGRARIHRTAWGVSGNMVGMMPPTTALVADMIFVKA